MSSNTTHHHFSQHNDNIITNADGSAGTDTHNINKKLNNDDSDTGMIVGMNSWIDATTQSLKRSTTSNTAAGNDHDNSLKNNVVCSREYLSCALKIAHSIANQLCVVDKKSDMTLARGFSDNECRDRLLKPSMQDEVITIGQQQQHRKYDSLSHGIYVRCGMQSLEEEKPNDDIDPSVNFSTDDFEPLSLHHSDQPYESENLHELAQHLSSLPGDGSDHIDYLDVKSVTLRLTQDDVKDLCINDDARMVMMQSLGLTFFQIFSGGQSIGGGRGNQSFLGSSASANSTRLDHLSKKTQRVSLVRQRSSSYAEALESLGLPVALCALINNIMESTHQNDCVAGDESYETMSDIRDDLKLMIDSPDVYLRDTDMSHDSNAFLQIENAGVGDVCNSFHGRELELEVLKKSYQRASSSGDEIAMIYGSSGIGKSMLSRKFAEHVSERGDGVFLSGSFDRLKQSQPLQALSNAFDGYCTWLSARDTSAIKMVSSALRQELGDDISSLVSTIPKLGDILGDDFVCKKDIVDSNVAMDSQKRLRYLFCRFIDILLGCQEETLILFLDDCQWIDPASVALLNQILMIARRRFLFFGCCRDNEVDEKHPLTVMLSSLQTFGTRTTDIMLTSMTSKNVNEMLSHSLSLLPRITRPLSDILYHKTKGNPFFIKQLVMELRKRRLLHLSLSRRRWVWETDKIRDMEIPENVATFILESFYCLPPDVLSALSVLSCFGSRVEISLIEILEAEIDTPLIAPLDRAVSESIVDKWKGEYVFVHDKLQEAAYGVIIPEQRCLQHVKYGLALGNVAVRDRSDTLLICAVSQINHGGPQAVADREQGVAVARLNLDAGKKAMGMSDFFSAHSFFDHGISFLRKGHWEEQYDLSLDLFNLAAKCALMNAEYDHLEILTRQIMHYARSFEDKYQATSISITLLLQSGKLDEGVKLTLDTLKTLGEEVSPSPWWLPQIVIDFVAPSVIQQHLNQTEAKLAEFSDETLLSYPAMVDPAKILAMELLATLFELVVYSGDTSKATFIMTKMLQITLKHGMSPLSPQVFVQYGTYVALGRQHFELGSHYVRLGLSLAKQSPCSKAHDGQIKFQSAFTRMHFEPQQSAAEVFLEGFNASMRSGATRCAMKCAYIYHSSCLWNGKNLNTIEKSMQESLKQMRFHKNLLLMTAMFPMFRFVMRMIGESAIPKQIGLTCAFGETRNEQDVIEKIPPAMVTNHFFAMYEAYIFREFEKVRESAEKFNSLNSQTSQGIILYNRVL